MVGRFIRSPCRPKPAVRRSTSDVGLRPRAISLSLKTASLPSLGPFASAVQRIGVNTRLTQKAPEGARAAAKSAKCITALRTGASHMDWQPY